MNARRVLAAAVTAAAAAYLPSLHAATVTFQHGVNGYLGTSDTTLQSSDPDTVLGALNEVSIDASDGGSPNHVLLRFDNLFGNGAGQIGAAHAITSAKLLVNISSVGSGVIFHDMLVTWSQNTATWNSFGSGVQANGIEAVASPFASIGANNGESNIFESTLEVDVTASLQAVKAGTLPGHGWALLPFMPNGTNGVDFYTSEEFTTSLRPLLTVEIQPVPEPETYALMAAGLGLVAFAVRRRKAPR